MRNTLAHGPPPIRALRAAKPATRDETGAAALGIGPAAGLA